MLNPLPNLMLQHACIDKFIKHYLPRRVTTDTKALVSGYEPHYQVYQSSRAKLGLLKYIYLAPSSSFPQITFHVPLNSSVSSVSLFSSSSESSTNELSRTGCCGEDACKGDDD
jgi:hypothetical protein